MHLLPRIITNNQKIKRIHTSLRINPKEAESSLLLPDFLCPTAAGGLGKLMVWLGIIKLRLLLALVVLSIPSSQMYT